ncbi:MAG: hypothetical protein KC487_04695 [Anaerolineae bacterium]|nr:hypothetical protein [Anaerolineae bacterium]
MNNNWKRVGMTAGVLAMSAMMVFAGAAFAQGNGPGNNAAQAAGQANQYGSGTGTGTPVYGQANQYGNGSGGVESGYGLATRGAWGGPDSSLTAVAAEVIGIEQADLVAELTAGATIADVAADYNVDLQDIVDAYVQPRTDTLDAAVAAGRITEDQADAMLAQMEAQVSDQLAEAWEAQGNGYGNGTCDGTCTGTPGQSGSGPNWSDADGDGTCDNYGSMQQNMQGRRGGSMMSSHGGRGNR